MTQRFVLKLPTPGIAVVDGRGTVFAKMTGLILAAVAAACLAVLLLAAELRFTPEQRMDLLNATTHTGP
jgi:hypothetical protein